MDPRPLVPCLSLAVLLASALSGASAFAQEVPPPPPPPPVAPVTVAAPAPAPAPGVPLEQRVPVVVPCATPAEVAAAATCPTLAGASCAKGCWIRKAALAFGLGQGNSDYMDLRADASVERKATPWGFFLGATFVYGEKDGDVNAENWRVLGKVERKLSERAYAFGRVQYDHDEMADLEYRVNAVAGAGYTLVDSPRTKLKAEAGGGATFEKYEDEEETVDPSAYVGIDFAQMLGKAKVEAGFDSLINLGEPERSLNTFEIHVLTPLGACFNVDVGLRLDYVIDPPGETEELDLLFTVGLRVEF